jgi:magnesium transporter
MEAEDTPTQVTLDDLEDVWPMLPPDDRVTGFRLLSREDAEDFFLRLDGEDQLQLILSAPAAQRRFWMRLLEPDDAADVVQASEDEQRTELLALLDDRVREEVRALMAYAEDDAGGLMSTRFVRVRPDMTVDEAIRYLRKQAREKVETLSYTYVLDAHQRLLGVVSFRQLFQATGDKHVADVMVTDLVTVPEEMDQEEVGRIFAQHDLVAVPVLDGEGRMKGIVTIDDIVDVVEEEATEDIQKLGGMQALEAPYLQVGLWEMVKKRAGWLTVLMLGQMLTASVMGHFADRIATAVVLALFVPLVISCGGNSGSQASTLVIRALALGELRLKDWRRVLWREMQAGLALGLILGVLGVARIVAMPPDLSANAVVRTLDVALVVGASVSGVVLWGATMGAMLPLVLHRAGFDPASASAPFVATLVDVTGLIIYFSVATAILSGGLG